MTILLLLLGVACFSMLYLSIRFFEKI
jgi:hypothetical protein